MKKNLIIVNTYFQLITAINLCINELKSDVNDIILTDRSINMEEVMKKLKKYNIFHNIFFIKNKIKKYLIYLFNRKKIIGDIIKEEYDYLAFFNYDLLTYSIFDEMVKINSNAKCIRYEEGFNIYLSKIENNKINSFLRTVLHRKSLYKSTDFLYLYNPDLLCYKPCYEVKEISKLDKNNLQLKEVYNDIFNYNDKEEIKQKYIFLEESFYCDNYPINDLDLVLKIANIVGNDNLLVKLHPRNNFDRFKKYGIKSNNAIGIPWEVIQMNNDFSNKVFITISSGSILASKLYFNDKIKTYLLFNCTDNMSNMVNDDYYKYLEKINNKFGLDNFIIPKDEKEFLERLRNE